jgi:hypothetical protein
MAIKSKDGKVYTLQGPNPVVERQVSWDRSKLVFHNFEWEETIGRRQPRTREDPPKKPIEKEMAMPRVEAADAKQEEPAHNDGPPQTKAEFDMPHIKYRVLCHCLPAKVELRRDELYGESWTRTTYGSKFVFPCVMMSSDDLAIEFWTSDPRQQISDKSVVYPFSYETYNADTSSYDRIPYDDYRWWRVTSREAKEGGWLIAAGPSDFQPDFSD